MPVFNEKLVIRPEDPAPFGCPILTGLKAVTGRQGMCHIIEWPFRSAEGNPVDLADLLDPASEDSEDAGDSGQVIFRFTDAIQAGSIYQRIGWSDSPVTGKVLVRLDSPIIDAAGLWKFDVAITDATGQPIQYSEGLLSIERSNFGVQTDAAGPLTLNEVRMKMRDFLGANDPGVVEFTTEDILQAIQMPIMEWNEALPPIRPLMTASTFPFRFNWMQAVCGYLLQTAAHWARRNRFRGSVAGITDESRNFDESYDRVSMTLLEQWRQFITMKKMSINASNGFGSLGSSYSRW